MKSISAKEFRLNMKDILNKVKSGESFRVIYKSKEVAKLVPPESFDENLIKENQVNFTPNSKKGKKLTNKEIAERIRKFVEAMPETKYSKMKNFDYKKEYYKDMKKKYDL